MDVQFITDNEILCESYQALQHAYRWVVVT